MIVASELETATVGVGSVEPLRPWRVLYGAALEGTKSLRALQHILKTGPIDVKRDLIWVVVAVATLRAEEHQQRVANPDRIMNGTERLSAGEVEIEASQRGRIVTSKSDVVDA
jgi:hypothetical protein